MENERWGVESEEREMGEWRMRDGEWRVKNERWGSGE